MAKIIGNITATPSPKPDWAQADPAKADFIKNKPSLANGEGENSLIQLVPEEPNVATGNNTFVTGKGNKALYDNQTIIGTYNDDSNPYIFSIGNGTDDANRKNALSVSPYGTVNIGEDNIELAGGGNDWVVSGAMIGNNLALRSGRHDYSVAVGKYNLHTRPCIFMVGNGDEDQRSNAFEVRTSGAVYFHNGIAVNKAETEALIDEKITTAISGAISASY